VEKVSEEMLDQNEESRENNDVLYKIYDEMNEG